MSQEELQQLKDLLEKAENLLPKCQRFSVEKSGESLILCGYEISIYTGTEEKYYFTLDGVILSEGTMSIY